MFYRLNEQSAIWGDTADDTGRCASRGRRHLGGLLGRRPATDSPGRSDPPSGRFFQLAACALVGGIADADPADGRDSPKK